MLFGLPQLTRPLRASLSLKPVLKWTLVSTLLFVGAVVGTALVAANAEGDRASLSDEATAAAVLGRPLPAIRSVDLALNRSASGSIQSLAHTEPCTCPMQLARRTSRC